MWFWWALASAVVSGISVTFNKRVLNRGIHSSLLSFVLFAFLTIISLPLLLATSKARVDMSFYIACLVSALVFALAKTIALRIYKNTNLSDIYPLASIAPVTLYMLSVLFLAEHINPLGVLGIIVMTVGVYLLNFDKSNKNIFHPLKELWKNKNSVVFIGAILLSNISAISEKIAINHTFPQNVYYLAFWENLFLALITGGYVLKTNKGWVKEIRSHSANILIAGVLYSVLYFFVMFGFRDGPISLVSTIKKLEVLFVLIISFIFFKERPTGKIYIATLIMLLAVLLIKL